MFSILIFLPHFEQLFAIPLFLLRFFFLQFRFEKLFAPSPFSKNLRSLIFGA
jgi:hypothetical protein